MNAEKRGRRRGEDWEGGAGRKAGEARGAWGGPDGDGGVQEGRRGGRGEEATGDGARREASEWIIVPQNGLVVPQNN